MTVRPLVLLTQVPECGRLWAVGFAAPDESGRGGNISQGGANMKRMRIESLAVLAIAGLALTVGALALQEKATEAKEEFSANLMTWTSGAAAGKSTRLNMTVDRWATEEELAGFKKVLTEGGPDALYKALAGRDMGRIQTTQSYEYRIYLAISVPTEKGRIVKLVTERPVFMKEAVRDADTLEYIYSYIELTLDAKGKGSGKILGTAKIVVDKNAKVDVETHGQPQTLMNARKV